MNPRDALQALGERILEERRNLTNAFALGGIVTRLQIAKDLQAKQDAIRNVEAAFFQGVSAKGSINIEPVFQAVFEHAQVGDQPARQLDTSLYLAGPGTMLEKLASLPPRHAKNLLEEYVESALQTTIHSQPVQPFVVRSSKLPHEIGRKITALTQEQIQEIVGRIEGAILEKSLKDGTLDQAQFDAMKKAGFGIKIVKDGYQEPPFELSPEVAEIAAKVVKALFAARMPNRNYKQITDPETLWKYTGPAWTTFNNALGGKEPKVFTFEFKDLPEALQKEMLEKSTKDGNAMISFLLLVGTEIVEHWFPNTRPEPFTKEDAYKAMKNGWRIEFK